MTLGTWDLVKAPCTYCVPPRRWCHAMGGPGKRDDGLQAGHFSRGSVRPHCARESRKGTWGNRKSKSKGSKTLAMQVLAAETISEKPLSEALPAAE